MPALSVTSRACFHASVGISRSSAANHVGLHALSRVLPARTSPSRIWPAASVVSPITICFRSERWALLVPVRDVRRIALGGGSGIIPEERKGRRVRVQQRGRRLAQRLPADPQGAHHGAPMPGQLLQHLPQGVIMERGRRHARRPQQVPRQRRRPSLPVIQRRPLGHDVHDQRQQPSRRRGRRAHRIPGQQGIHDGAPPHPLRQESNDQR